MSGRGRPGTWWRAAGVAGVLVVSALAVAQPDPTLPPSDDPWGSAGSGSAGSAGTPIDPDVGSAGSGSAGSGSAGSAAGSAGSGSAIDPNAGSGSGVGTGSGSGPRIIQIPTDANAPQVSAAAAPTTVTLGNKFTLFVTATFNPGVEVNLREPLDLGPAFEVTRRLSEDKPTGDGRTTREWQVEVIAWELGDLVMPPVAVTYTAFGKADQVATNTVKIKVNGMLGDVVDDPKAVRDNAPPKELLTRDWFWLYAGIGGALLIGALITMVVLIRNSRRRRMVFAGVGGRLVARKFDTASERALYKLLEIENSGVLDRDEDRKQGHAEMVEVIREYIGSRYRVVTQDLTSSELLRKLAPLAPEAERRLIEAWLERCDIVKYGGLQATADQAGKTLSDARELVVATTTEQAAATPPAEPPSPEPPSPEPPSPEPRPETSSQEAA